jgi:predicted Zn-dependent protease
MVALCIARQDNDSANEFAQRLLRLQPQSKNALQALTTLALRAGDATAAIDYCTRLLKVDPNSFEGWFNLRFAQENLRPAEHSTRASA